MLVKINGEEVDVADASTIQDVIDETNAPYTPGSIICLIKGKKELEKNISKYKIKTNKGSIIIQLDESDEAKPLVDVWKNQYGEFVDLDIRWSTPTEVAIGPIVTDLEPTSDEYKYFEGDVVLSLSSFSNESTHLIMLKENTTNVYSVPQYNKGIFAHIIGGKKTLDNLTDDDKVTGIEPVIERSTTTDSASVSDLNTVLEEGNELYTYISFNINEDSPVCVEHLFSLIKDGRIKVSYDSESFVGFYELAGIEKPKEDNTLRSRGTITVRNTGVGVGRLYIYRANRVLTPNHTTVGQIVNGMEIIDIAKENDFITVKSEQQRLMLLNKTQREASEMLSAVGVEHMIDGIVDDNAIIVEQTPKHTIDILREGKVITKAVNKEDLCTIKFNENAPRSVRYFKFMSQGGGRRDAGRGGKRGLCGGRAHIGGPRCGAADRQAPGMHDRRRRGRDERGLGHLPRGHRGDQLASERGQGDGQRHHRHAAPTVRSADRGYDGRGGQEHDRLRAASDAGAGDGREGAGPLRRTAQGRHGLLGRGPGGSGPDLSGDRGHGEGGPREDPPRTGQGHRRSGNRALRRGFPDAGVCGAPLPGRQHPRHHRREAALLRGHGGGEDPGEPGGHAAGADVRRAGVPLKPRGIMSGRRVGHA